MQVRALIASIFLSAACTVPAAHAADPANSIPAAPEQAAASKFRNVGVKEFDELRKKPGTVVLDVRTPAEFAKGHIEGATNIDVMAPDFASRVGKLDKSKTYLVNCAAGVRSARACKQMGELDFPSLVNLKGGYAAWSKEMNGSPAESK